MGHTRDLIGGEGVGGGYQEDKTLLRLVEAVETESEDEELQSSELVASLSPAPSKLATGSIKRLRPSGG